MLKNNSFLLVFVALWGCLAAFSIGKESRNPTLRLVHTVFRHGNRNPDSGSVIPSSPYYNESFYPEGLGQLTNAGKLTEYKIGTALRKRYNDFLTDTWNINYLDVRTTNVNRTKMSAALMLAGLYPPRGNQRWSLLNWLPIPYNYLLTSEDKETQAWSACSTRWNTLLNEIISSPEISDYLLRYKELFNILSEKTGGSVGIWEAFSYHFGFATQLEVGYTLEEWTKSVYPEPIHSAAVDFYYITTNNTAIRRLMAGYLLRKILTDTKAKIDGTISPSSRKLFIYSGHELNVASTVLSLEAFKLVDIPAYGAYVLFEVHEIDGVWGIKETQAWSACSTRWNTLLNEIISSPEISDYLLRYKELFNILSEKTGGSVGIWKAFSYHFGFATQLEVGYTLEEWTKSVYPEPIHSAAVDFYYITTNNTAIRRLMAGYLLRKILTDTKAKIDGTISPSSRKLFIYSGHELNVASTVLSLEAFKLVDIPAYGAYVLFEVHEIDGVWGIKLFYQDYENNDPHAIKLPGCDYFCPYDDFYNLVEEILPKDDTDCYGS